MAIVALCLVVLLTGCRGRETPADASTAAEPSFDAIAETYVRLVLAVGQHDANYVDAYYGPEDWSADAAGSQRPLAELRSDGEALLAAIQSTSAPADPMLGLRRAYLLGQITSLVARVRMLQGERLPFDEETRLLYDAVAPAHPESFFQTVLDELGRLLDSQGVPPGPVSERITAYREAFVVPPERVDAVYRAAIDGCRERTLAHVALPEGESFEVEYVKDKAWSAYNWYQGRYHSLIQVNLDLPFQIGRALDLACHEGYPGHHVYNALLEKDLVGGRGWIEYEVYPLFSPQSLIAEGTANLGIEMAFPGDERLRFERDVLFPLAGLDPERAADYNAVRQLMDRLSYASNEAARRYLDGEIDADAAAAWLERFGAMSPEQAGQRVRFIDQYRGYVINYNYGLDLVRDYLDTHAELADDGGARWQAFVELLSTPRMPSGLS